MATTPSTPEPPEPGPAHRQPAPPPLSRREKHALAGLEAHVSAEDPALSARLGALRPTLLERISPRALNRTVQALVLVVLALVILPAAWAVVLATFVVVAVAVTAIVVMIRQADP